jgi:Flp pilus assembly protein TadD
MGLAAEQYGKLAQPEPGLLALADALAAVERTGERWCEAELYRFRGVLLDQRGNAVEAEEAYRRALRIARQQEARELEVRAVSSLKSSREPQAARYPGPRRQAPPRPVGSNGGPTRRFFRPP